MRTASLVLGVLAIIGMIIGFIPCLGALNWLVIPFSLVGLIVSILAYTQPEPGNNPEPNGNALAGIVMCGVALFFSFIRLILGGGII